MENRIVEDLTNCCELVICKIVSLKRELAKINVDADAVWFNFMNDMLNEHQSLLSRLQKYTQDEIGKEEQAKNPRRPELSQQDA